MVAAPMRAGVAASRLVRAKAASWRWTAMAAASLAIGFNVSMSHESSLDDGILRKRPPCPEPVGERLSGREWNRGPLVPRTSFVPVLGRCSL